MLAGNRSLKKWREEMNSLQAFIVTAFSKAHTHTLHKLKGRTKKQGPRTGPSPGFFPGAGR